METYKYLKINDDYYRIPYRRHPQRLTDLHFIHIIYITAQYTPQHTYDTL